MTLKQRILKDLENGAVLSSLNLPFYYNSPSAERRLRELKADDPRITDRWVKKDRVRYKETYIPRGKT